MGQARNGNRRDGLVKAFANIRYFGAAALILSPVVADMKIIMLSDNCHCKVSWVGKLCGATTAGPDNRFYAGVYNR